MVRGGGEAPRTSARYRRIRAWTRAPHVRGAGTLGGVTPLVRGDWLAERLGDRAIVLLDCRFDLLDPASAAARFTDGHLPGAVHADLDRDLSGPRSARPNGRGRHPLPAADAFGAAMRRLGVREDATVVTYDEGMTGGAARAWFLLRHHGHPDVRVLDGGLAAWSGPLVRGPATATPGDFAPRPARADIVDHAELLEERDDRLVVDVRAPERYRGDVEPFDAAAGHVPGAVNIPFATMPPAPPTLLEHAGPVVAYCGSGVTGCIALLALAAAGRDDALLYPGSWSDWAARGLPVATGAAPA